MTMWSTPYQQATVAPWLAWRSLPPPAAKGSLLLRQRVFQMPFSQ
jgi:hypothetical protein